MVDRNRPLSFGLTIAFAWSLVGVAISGCLVGLAVIVTGPHQPHPHPAILPSFYTDALVMVPWEISFQTAFFELACALAAIGAIYGSWQRGYAVPASGGDRAIGATKTEILFGLIFVAIVYLVIAPHSFSDIATTLTGPHDGSYLFIPAIDFLAPHATPGIDFESHYGIGVPWVYSFFLGSTFEASTRHAAIYICVVTVGFYASIYLLARYLLGNITAALIASAALCWAAPRRRPSSLMLASGFDGFSYSIPSDLPIRFLICPLFLGSIIAVSLKPDPKLFAVVGSLAALAVWWQTDTGLYCLCSALGFSICLVVTRHKHWSAIIFLLAAFAVTFPLVLFTTTGEITLSEFPRLLEPVFLYSGGFGGVPMKWHATWSRIYDLLTPTLIGATGAIGLKTVWQEDELNKAANAFLVLSGFAFLVMMKWVNRSIDVVWWLNAWPVILIIALWWQIVAARRLALAPIRIGFGLLAVCVCIKILFVNANSQIDGGLSRSPAERWEQYFLNHPSYASDAYLYLAGIKRDPDSQRQPRPITQSATAFLRDRTRDGERVTVFSQADWQYLLDARRPSAFYWLPLHLTHSWVLLDRNEADLKSASTIFIEDGYWDIIKRWNIIAFERLERIPLISNRNLSVGGNWCTRQR